MFLHYQAPDYKCSQCGSINRYALVCDPAGWAPLLPYKACIDCGHTNKPTVTTSGSSGTYFGEARTAPTIVEF